MSKTIVVVGGGVIGLATAAELAKRGHKVTVVERDPARRGSSLGNAGMVVPSHFVPLAAPGMVWLGMKWMFQPESPFYIKPRLDWGLMRWAWGFWRASTKAHVERSSPLLRDLHMASRALYASMPEAGGDIGLKQKGLLMLCRSDHGLEEESVAADKALALGVPAQVLTAGETARLDPGVTMDVKGSVFYPRDCHLQPERYVASLLQEIEAAGGILLSGVNVNGWQREGRRLRAVVTSHGPVEADEFVLAGGAWSPDLMRGLDLRLPMEAGKGYSVTVENPVELPEICSILTEARVAVTPMGGGLRFGGTMEIAGRDEGVNQRRVKGIVRSVPGYFPQFREEHFEGLAPWSGMRPCSPDGLPYLGRTGAAENLLVATGHAMMGLSLAPVTGQIVGRLVDGEPAGFDLSMLRPDRYA